MKKNFGLVKRDLVWINVRENKFFEWLGENGVRPNPIGNPENAANIHEPFQAIATIGNPKNTAHIHEPSLYAATTGSM